MVPYYIYFFKSILFSLSHLYKKAAEDFSSAAIFIPPHLSLPRRGRWHGAAVTERGCCRRFFIPSQPRFARQLPRGGSQCRSSVTGHGSAHRELTSSKRNCHPRGGGALRSNSQIAVIVGGNHTIIYEPWDGYAAASSIFSMKMPYPVWGSFTRTWVTAPMSFPSWMMGEPLTND